MLQASISADVIASTSLSTSEMKSLSEKISEIFARLNDLLYATGDEKIVHRLVLGDTIECFIPRPGDALRIALTLKAGIKSFKLDGTTVCDREREKLRKLFEMYGVRIAIGIGNMSWSRLDDGAIFFNGSAINLSGRLVAGQKTSNKERITVKNTLFIGSDDELQSAIFKPVMSLLDAAFNRMTLRQSEIIYRKLLGLSEGTIAKELGITQSSVNQHSTSAGWNSIEETLNLFYTFDFNTNFAS